MFGLAGAVPQNAAIQRIAPNEMRGQVTAVYLFMFTFFGAVGSLVIGFVGRSSSSATRRACGRRC